MCAGNVDRNWFAVVGHRAQVSVYVVNMCVELNCSRFISGDYSHGNVVFFCPFAAVVGL